MDGVFFAGFDEFMEYWCHGPSGVRHHIELWFGDARSVVALGTGTGDTFRCRRLSFNRYWGVIIT